MKQIGQGPPLVMSRPPDQHAAFTWGAHLACEGQPTLPRVSPLQMAATLYIQDTQTAWRACSAILIPVLARITMQRTEQEGALSRIVELECPAHALSQK